MVSESFIWIYWPNQFLVLYFGLMGESEIRVNAIRPTFNYHQNWTKRNILFRHDKYYYYQSSTPPSLQQMFNVHQCQVWPFLIHWAGHSYTSRWSDIIHVWQPIVFIEFLNTHFFFHSFSSRIEDCFIFHLQFQSVVTHHKRSHVYMYVTSIICINLDRIRSIAIVVVPFGLC